MSGVERLARQLDAEGEKGPRRAILALAKAGRPALKPLLEAARSQKTRLRRWAVEALGSVGGKAALPAIRRAARDPRILLEDPSGGIRINAVDALGRSGDGKAVPALRRRLKDPKDYVRRRAAEAIRRLSARS